MKRLSVLIGAAVLVGFAGYLAYQVYLPQIIAHGITNDESLLVPDRLEARLDRVRQPVNDGAGVVIETMHRKGVTMDEILKAIDETEEEQAFAFLDELNATNLQTTNQVFDLAKRHFPVEFDVEIFRKPFNERVNMATIRKGMYYANMYRENGEIDSETAKSIAKRILLQKEDEFKRVTKVE